jgi:hypothetical protein
MNINGVVGGDSMASNDRPGVPLGEGVSGYLEDIRPGETWNWYSAGGLQIEGMISSFEAQIQPFFQSGKTNIYVPFSLLHGNCQDTSQTASEIITLYEDLQALAQGFGWKTFAITVPGTTEFNDPLASPYKRPVREQVNAALRDNGWAGADYFLDLDTFPGICTLCVPDSGDADPVYYLNDTPAFGAVHLTPFSNSLIATGISAAINNARSPMATPQRLAGPQQLTSAAATIYTCPADTITVIKRIRLSNPSGNERTFTISIGADAAGTRIYSGVSIPAGSGKDIWGPFTLEEADILQAFADANSAVVIEVDGTEQPQ